RVALGSAADDVARWLRQELRRGTRLLDTSSSHRPATLRGAATAGLPSALGGAGDARLTKGMGAPRRRRATRQSHPPRQDRQRGRERRGPRTAVLESRQEAGRREWQGRTPDEAQPGRPARPRPERHWEGLRAARDDGREARRDPAEKRRVGNPAL